MREIIADSQFQRGFILLSAQPGKRVPVGKLAGPQAGAPAWDLCEWSSQFPLPTNQIALTAPAHWSCTNAAKQVMIGRAGVGDWDLLLGVNASVEYAVHARRANEPWVHLLVQQSFSNPPALSQLSRAQLYLEARLLHSRKIPTPDYTPNLHAAQFLMYFTVQNLNRKSPGHGRLLWFGVPIYDDRSQFAHGHEAKDPGTGMFIYSLPGDVFARQSTHDGGWVVFDLDLLPLMKKGLATAWRNNFLTESKDLADYRLSGMNLGWEVPGTFAVSAAVRKLSLNVILK